MTETKDTCLCITEGHPGLQDVGYYDGAGSPFKKTGETTCLICEGTTLSPRTVQEAKDLVKE